MGKYLMDVNEVQTFAPTAAMSVVGNTGLTETFKIVDGSTGTVSFLGNTVDRVEVARASTAYSYQATATGIDVYYGTAKVAQLANGQKMAFTDGAATVVQTVDTTSGAITTTFGTKTVSSTAPVLGATLAPTVTTATGDASTMTPAAPPAPIFNVTTAAAAEGASATFTVTLSSAQTVATTVAYAATLAGGATAADATLPASGTLTFAAGETSKTVVIPFLADTNSPEAGEGVTLTLSNPTGASTVLGTAAATATITDVPTTYTLTASAASALEGGLITFTVKSSTNVTAATDVVFTVTPGDATAANAGTSNTNLNDFAAGTFNPNTVTIPAGSNTATFTVSAANDGITELPENYSVKAVIAGNTLTQTVSLLDGTSSTGGQSFTFTTGIDSLATMTGGAGNDTYTGVLASSAANGLTFSALDSIDGGAGTNTLTINDIAGAVAFNTGIKVVNIQTATLNAAGAAGVADVSGWTGLTAFNVNSTGGAPTLTAAGTTAVTVTDSALAAAAIGINGGSTVNVTAAGATTGTITIGATTKPLGAVVVKNTLTGAVSGGQIAVTGGTTVDVTSTTSNIAGATAVTADNAVNVTGAAGTTTAVTVTQDTAQSSKSAVAAVAGVVAVGAVTAAPGTTGVTLVSAVAPVAAVTARVGTTANGKVLIADANYNTTAANTIATVTLNNYGAGSSIQTTALTTLNLKGTAGTLFIENATAGGNAALSGLSVAGATPLATNNTLALNLNTLSGTNTINDLSNEITTLNVTATVGNSKLAAFTDTGLKTLNVAGDKVFTLSAINGSLTKIAVSGAAGFNDGGVLAGSGIAALGAAVAFTTTSTGAITATLDALTQAFDGKSATGKTTITVSGLAAADSLTAKAITGGSGTTDELILGGAGAYALTLAKTGGKFSGFETLGVQTTQTGTIDMATLGSGNTFTGLHYLGEVTGAKGIAFTNVPTTVNMLTIDAVDATAAATISVSTAAATGPTTTFGVTINGTADSTLTTGVANTITSLTLQDGNTVGLGTVNIVSNNVGFNTANVITTLVDNGLGTLNVSGTGGLTITNLNETANQATTFTINNTETNAAGVTIGTFTDAKLGVLHFQGSNATTINTISNTTSAVVSIDNTGTSTATIGAWTASALTSLTLSGKITLTATADLLPSITLTDGVALNLTDGLTSGITVSGAADNSRVSLILAGAVVTKTDTITLGNGNNSITDASAAGTVNVTVGTGSNLIKLGDVDGTSTTSTGVYSVTLGTHTAATGSDYIYVTTANASATAANTVITGAVTGDRIYFGGDFGSTATGTITATTAGATEAATITALNTAVTAHGVAYAVYDGNTYVVQSLADTATNVGDTHIVKLIGSHTISATTDAGAAIDYITLLS